MGPGFRGEAGILGGVENESPGDIACKPLKCGHYPHNDISIADFTRLGGGAISLLIDLII